MSDDLVERLRSKIIVHTDAAVWMLEAADRIEQLEAKLAKAVEALRGSRETILELVNSRWSEAEGTDQDWVGYIDTTIAKLKGQDHDTDR